MKFCSKSIIYNYMLLKLKYDFMGYEFDSIDDLSFHHLLISSQLSPLLNFDRGYFECNRVMLSKYTSHEYLHIVELYDLDRFYAITSEMLDEKIKGYVSLENLVAIDDILNGFERDFASQTFPNGHKVIKDSYTKRLVKTAKYFNQR